MSQPHPRDFAPAPLSPPFRAVISQSLACDLFISRNETFWDSCDRPEYFWGYLRENRTWHKCPENGGLMLDNWRADRHCQPFEDYLPEVHRDIQRVIRPLLETATPAEQRRAGSFALPSPQELNAVNRLAHERAGASWSVPRQHRAARRRRRTERRQSTRLAAHGGIERPERTFRRQRAFRSIQQRPCATEPGGVVGVERRHGEREDASGARQAGE